jgi:hypothetical protein
MNPLSDAAAQAAIGAAARELPLPAVRDQAARLAGIAAREHATHLPTSPRSSPPSRSARSILSVRKSCPRTRKSRVGTAIIVGLLAVLLVGACGSVHRSGEPSGSTPGPARGTGMATVKGHVSWPDWACSAQGCPRVEDTPVHFADAAANRTFTAFAGSSGGYSIRIPAGSYVVIAGRADRSPHQRQITVQPGEHLTLNLTITPPTG